ncbi:Co2+/Mg2+ efflux protein ApaG [Flocculibacter collagenilyticus]|uniref:Co2+/Mg2+ efflux protein ApaG n=1 Tax=Flocculibacter collagenilyticus TaxID=2744479 RepID=UPI0018F74523|nr:Co2+/Mg2+ efflux protein ApaG [Flocculibacter collagenilyticus]
MEALDNFSKALSIQIKTEYIASQSNLDKDRYVFAYTITIANHGDKPAQLLSRYWLISDTNGKKIEVRGDGVVGEQPIIAPSSQYTYSSGSVLETPVGTMEGYYVMQDMESSEQFKLNIPIFRLAQPNILN